MVNCIFFFVFALSTIRHQSPDFFVPIDCKMYFSLVIWWKGKKFGSWQTFFLGRHLGCHWSTAENRYALLHSIGELGLRTVFKIFSIILLIALSSCGIETFSLNTKDISRVFRYMFEHFYLFIFWLPEDFLTWNHLHTQRMLLVIH